MEQTRSSSVPSDRELVCRLASGDETAVGDFERLYGPRIHQLALRYVKDPEEAREITQDVLFKTVAKIAAFRGDSALSSWLYRVTFNASMSRLRRLRTLRAAETPASELVHDAFDGYSRTDVIDRAERADERTLRGQMRRRLVEAVKALPPIYRGPVILRDLRGLSIEEASNALRVKDRTLKSRLHRGRRLLRRALSDFQGGLAM